MWKLLKTLFAGAANAEQTAGTPPGRSETEFSAEIVRVTRLIPHPNADRLEIARFELKGFGETSYEVVVQKGSFTVDALAAYFSVDCVLPLSHPDFAFLSTRLDGAGKDFYRLRAARLRGVFSQGLLVPAGNFLQYGDNVAALFGVTYYTPEVKNAPGTTISTKRAGVQPIPRYAVDSLKKMPRLFETGERVCVTEKIHGTNFRFGWVRRKILGVPLGWRFVVGSHNTMRSGSDLYTQAADRMHLANVARKAKGLVFYGELYGHTYDGEKIQDLTYGVAPQEGPQLAIFDVWHNKERYWLDAWDRFDLCADLHLEHVPILQADAVYTEMLVDLHTTAEWSGDISTLDSKTIREGVVIESLQGPRRKAKFVTEKYLMRKGA